MKRFNLNWPRRPTPANPPPEILSIEGVDVTVRFCHSDRARGYRLAINRDSQVRVTIPRRGSMAEARQFLTRHHAWLAKHLRRVSNLPRRDAAWPAGASIYFRGQLMTLVVAEGADGTMLRLGDALALQLPPHIDTSGDLRPFVEDQLRGRAEVELDARTRELAAQRSVSIRRIEVRAQTSRWGSCSKTGTVSLNWRLIQTPPEVRDYVIIHELMHSREMNHSDRFWTLVAAACPGYRACERWLKEHGVEIL